MNKSRLLRKEIDDLRLDLTPLIDVVFLLLIFFMVSTSFETTHWLDVTLPGIDANNPAADVEIKPFIVGVDGAGHYHMNEKDLGMMDAQQLKKYLSAQINADAIVVIHGEEQAPHGAVIRLLDVLGQLNITQVQMAGVSDS
jgi:biopolymer transport protein ExbD